MANSPLPSARRRIRVAHVTLGLDVGGQERLLVEFARHAERARFDLTFLSMTTRGKLAQAIEALGWRVLALEQPPGLRPGRIFGLAHLFRRRRFDVIHTHDDKPLLYSALAVKLGGVRRFVHTQHHGMLPRSAPTRQHRLVAWAGRLTSAFVCVSQNSAQYMETTGLPARRITTLWNGIDLERYPYQGPHSAGPALTVARLSPEKDIANLIRAAALVVPSDPAFRLEIAGDGPLREELQRLASDLRLTAHVRFLGEVRDIPGLLARARLFVLPSQTEGISLTILEAMACGLPVVATRVGGNPEVVVHETTGVLVPAQDPAALAQGLRHFWNNGEVGQAMGRAGRHRVESHFDIRTMVRRYEHLYISESPPKQVL